MRPAHLPAVLTLTPGSPLCGGALAPLGSPLRCGAPAPPGSPLRWRSRSARLAASVRRSRSRSVRRPLFRRRSRSRPAHRFGGALAPLGSPLRCGGFRRRKRIFVRLLVAALSLTLGSPLRRRRSRSRPACRLVRRSRSARLAALCFGGAPARARLAASVLFYAALVPKLLKK